MIKGVIIVWEYILAMKMQQRDFFHQSNKRYWFPIMDRIFLYTLNLLQMY